MEHLCKQENYLTQPPQWLEEYRVCLVDASDYSKQGSFHADFRFHSMVKLFTLSMVKFHFTEVREGEKISRYQTIQEKDIMIADRAYGTIKGIEYVVSKKADFLFRLKAKSFHLYTQNQEVFDLTTYLQENYEPEKLIDMSLFTNQGKRIIQYVFVNLAKRKRISKKAIGISKNPIQRKREEKSRICKKYIVNIYWLHVPCQKRFP